MKNITHGYANDRVGLIKHVQFVWIKSLRHILIMQLRMRSAYDSRCKQTTGIFSRQAKRSRRAKLDNSKLKC